MVTPSRRRPVARFQNESGTIEPFLVGLRLEDTSAVELAGDGLPYMVPDKPYLAVFEIQGIKGSSSKMPHPLDVAQTLAGVTIGSVKATATQSLTASNPVRRALLMEPTRELIDVAEQIREVLETATGPSFPKGLKWDYYPLAMMLGTTPIGKVKAKRGETFSFGEPVLIGAHGGYVDPYTEMADEPGAPEAAEAAATEETSMYEIGTHSECDGVAIVTTDGADLVDCFTDEAEAQAALDAMMASAEAEPAEMAVTLPDVSELDLNETAPWEGILAVEGTETGDGRYLMEESLTWRQLPLPLMLMTENPVGGDGHDGAKLAGRIDEMWREGTEIWGRGVIDLGSPAGAEAHRLLGKQMLRGVSADIDKVEWDLEADGDPLAEALGIVQSNRVAKGRVMGATLCVFPALEECSVWLTDEGGTMHSTPEALAASGGTMRHGWITWYTPLDEVGAAIVASAGNYPAKPPKAWFHDPKLTEPTPPTVTPEGEFYCHVAEWGALHIGMGRPTPVPKSHTNYSAFRTGTVETAEGTMVRTGPVVMDTVHPDLAMKASDAQAFYAHTGSAIADVAIGEDEFGIWVHGAIRPGTTDEQIRVLRASDLSPDWRTVNGKPRECCALLVVNNSGFKPLGALAASAGGAEIHEFVMPGRTAARIGDDGEVMALVASAHIARRSLLNDMISELSEMRSQFDRLRTQLSPILKEQARAQVTQLASRDRHPSAPEGRTDELAAARKRLARAQARRLSNRRR